MLPNTILYYSPKVGWNVYFFHEIVLDGTSKFINFENVGKPANATNAI